MLKRAYKAEEDTKQASILEKSQEALKQAAATATPTTPTSGSATPAVKPKTTIKLPKYEIKKFTGEPKDYRAFWDAFKVAIDENDMLTKVEKFTYLKGYLTGDAEESIKGLTSTDANYDSAVEILKTRYGNTQVIVNSHMRSLTNLGSVKDDKDTKRIRRLYDRIESDLRSLEALGVKPDGMLLVPLLLDKFPDAMNLRLSRRFDSNTDVWQVDKMMDELRKELQARERCIPEGGQNPRNPKKNEPASVDALVSRLKKEGFNVSHSQVETLLTSQQKPPPKKNQPGRSCVFCDGNHYPDQCQVVTEVAQRKEILKRKNRCFKCCKSGHVSQSCQSGKNCFRCKGSHHTSICDGRNVRQKDEAETADKEEEPVEEIQSTPAVVPGSRILLQTAQLDVRADRKGRRNRSVSCKVLLDSCSTRTHITRALAEKINAPIIRKENIQINGFGGLSKGPEILELAELILCKKGCNVHLRIQGTIVDKITNPLRGKYVQGNIDKFPHLQEVLLADDDSGDDMQEVSILIGIEYYHDIIIGAPIKVAGAPTMVASIFGYVISGNAGVEKDERSVVTTHVTTMLTTHMSNEELFESVKGFFEVQSEGIEEDDEKQPEVFDIDIEKIAGRYWVNYPFKLDHPPLRSNYRVSLRRLHGSCRRMTNDSKLREHYTAVMAEQEANGIIEPVPVPKDDDACNERMYYMPHHPVIREDKTTSKVRIVYDCSSKEEGASLNECLQTGTCLFADLLGVLVRFRCHPIGMTADIKQAFLQIGVKEESRDLTRFLWVQNPADMRTVIPREMRFTRVIFGGVSSMAILDNVNRHHLDACEDRYPTTVPLLRNSLYCDDFDGGAKDVETGFNVYSEVKEVYKDAGMDMRKWVTSNKELSARINELESIAEGTDLTDDTPTYASMRLNPDEKAPVKVLGIPWDTDTDELCLTLDSLKDYPVGRISKKVLLSGATKPFDPIGILAPVILPLRILFQCVCSKGEKWDSPLPARQQEIWDRFLEEAREFIGVRVPRFYGETSNGEIMMIGFGDASQSAYAACIYLRFHGKDNEIQTVLVAAKTRVAPVKKTTTPRLELLAALCLSRLTVKIKDELTKSISIQRVICLTDAEIVMNWIQNDGKKYGKYEMNRRDKIRKKVPVEHWYHVPGKLNSADLPSRGCFPRQMQQLEVQRQWLQGMDWMKDEEENWPIRQDVSYVIPETDEETVELTSCLVDSQSPPPKWQDVVPFKKFNNLSKLVRVVAWSRRFIRNCRCKEKEERKSGELDTDEYEAAKSVCIQSVQTELKSESGYEKRAASLGLYKDEEGLWRCKGRLGRAKIPFETKFPIIMPRSHHFTELLIREAHNNVYHNGVKETLSELRSRFWIVKGRQIVKKLLKKCFVCKKLEGLAYPPPATSDLPDFRVGASRAFETVGVDFCGPVYVKDIYEAGSMHKAYIVINTCTSTRMLHLELVPNLTTAAYVRSHQRFIGRRGYPAMMVSDNGKTFKGQELKKFNASHGINWKFNLSRAPWWGGMFERMVRSVKRCLKKAIGLRKLTFEELNTILIDIEAVVNSRPLVYVEENDLDQILTPSHLFCGRRTMDRETKLSPEIKMDLLRDDVIKRTKHISASIDHFWRRWSKEYLVELRENHRLKQTSDTPGVRPGDVVMMYENGVKRNRWPMGVIEKCITGKDGVVRGAVVRRIGEKGVVSVVNRPVQKLYPMEINANDLPDALIPSERDEGVNDNHDSNIDTTPAATHDPPTTNEVVDDASTSSSSTPNPATHPRPTRAAAIAGVAKRRMIDSKN